MLFQLYYKTNAYDKYLELNNKYIDLIEIYDTERVEHFLKKENLKNIIDNIFKKEHHDQAIKQVKITDIIRLMIMLKNDNYIYIDADVILNEEIVNLENDIKTYENVMDRTFSFYFIKCNNKDVIQNMINFLINADYKTLFTYTPNKIIPRIFFYKYFKLVDNKYLSKYFIHIGTTTKQIN